MDYRRLGRTDLSVSVLALGTVELGMDYGIRAPGHFGRPAEEDAMRLVHMALNCGINLIDTARAYGESERVLGLALHDRRAEVVLATKVALHQPDGSVPNQPALRQQMLASLQTSLELLQTDYVDVWQIHNVDEAVLARAAEVADVFAEVKQRGQVHWVGGSFYGAELPLAALETDLFDTYQVTYSVLDQRLADRFFAAAAARDVGVTVRSVLLQGALTARADHLPDHLAPLITRSRRFRELVAAHTTLSPAQVALAFALAHGDISTVLCGMRTTAELTENVQAAAAMLPQSLLDELRALRLDDANLLNPGTWGLHG